MDFHATYDRSIFLRWFRSNFLPDDFSSKTETVSFSFSAKYIQKVILLGISESLDLPVYEIHHHSENDPRVSLAKETFHLLAEYLVRNALIIFVSSNSENFRLSLISLDLKIVDGKIQKEFTNPRRYSFFLGPNCKTHTPSEFLVKKGRLKSMVDLQERFSVEVVNKEFYNEISMLFTKLVGGSRKIGIKTIDEKGQLQLPSLPNSEQNHQKYQEFAVRLLGRLVFCWFLKKKSSPSGVSLISEDLLSSQAVRENEHYYHNILEHLFFQVLNTPQDVRSEVVKDRFQNTPFLNGGLFEPHEDDYYNPDPVMGITRYLNNLIIPDIWFLELFTIFETYNFTIDENTTIDIELSIDPEMLGRIFENLLAEINPETGETARKSTGSYYTPRPIVAYMVDESLKQYLNNKTGLNDDIINPLLSYSEDIEVQAKDRLSIIQALDEIKVLDPACGSGAFPMGILQKMLLVLQKVDPHAEEARKRLLTSIHDPTLRSVISKKITGNQDLWDYTRKLNIIRKSVYGIDIQPISVEISKLRFFLSLIVDEKVQDDEDNRGIHALPNLEFKFVAANSLIGLHQEEDVKSSQSDLFEEDFFDLFQKKVEEYFSASTPAEKTDLRKTIFELIEKKIDEKIELIQSLSQFTAYTKKKEKRQLQLGIETNWLRKWESYKNLFRNETVEFFDLRYFFPECRDGFDLIIGNPPYVQLQKDDGKLARLYEQEDYQSFERTGDIYCLFYERGWQLLKEGGCLCYITSNKWMRAGYGESLRTFFLQNTQPLILIDFGDAPIFANATTYTNILLFVKTTYSKGPLVVLDLSREHIDHQPLPTLVEKKRNSFVSECTSERYVIVSEPEMRIKRKIESQGMPLRDWNVQINYGIKTGLNEAFIIDGTTRQRLIADDPKSAEIIKPILRGKDIKRYEIEFADLWLINSHNGVKEQGIPYIDVPKDYHAIYRHLQKFETKAKKREDQGNHWTNLRDCAYLDEFEKPKIVWGNLNTVPSYALDCQNSIIIAPANLLTSNEEDLDFIYAILNSKLMAFVFQFIAYSREGNFFEFKKIFVEKLPFKRVDKQVELYFNKLVKSILSYKSSGKKSDWVELQLDLLVYKLYNMDYSEIQIIDTEISNRISPERYVNLSLREIAHEGLDQ